MSSSKRLLEYRIVLIYFFNIVAIAVALFLAFCLRFDFSIPSSYFSIYLILLLPAIIIKLAIFWKMGLTRGWWRYASMADAVDIFKATVYSSIALTLFLVFTTRLEGIPRSVLILDWGLTFLLIAGARFFIRMLRERYLPFVSSRVKGLDRTLIIGAGETGQTIVREIRKSSILNNEVIGYVDDDPAKRGGRFQGLPMLGDQQDIERICEERGIDQVIIAIPSASAEQMRTIVEICQRTGVEFKTLPGVADLIDGRVTVQQLRDVDVRDLLGRHPIHLDSGQISSYLQGKRVLVTGAAGSIGSEICRQVLSYDPSSIALFDYAESPLFLIDRELKSSLEALEIKAYLGDVRDKARVEAIIKKFQPQVIFHAAAYKHVPMMEKNPAEAVNTNVRGTRIVADLAVEYGVETFVMISTDKAVNPTNVMGASKRTAEIYIQTLAQSCSTRFMTVRFGNVLDSAGSVVPIFREQIKNGGPVQVTDPEVTRFFMTIPEATQLVLQAGSMGEGGEIYLLDMGESVKIIDLAEEMIRLSGFEPYEEIDIEFIGLRPGEKLFEELLLDGENIKPTSHSSIFIADSVKYEMKQVLANLDKLYELQKTMDRRGIVAKLRKIVPEYIPAVNGGND